MKTALRVNTDFTTEILDLSSNEYDQLSGSVGGLIEAVDLGPDLTMWLNEEGKLIGLPVNEIGSALWVLEYGNTDIILGDVVFTGPSDENGDTLSLDDKWTSTIKELVATLEARSWESTL